MARYWCLQETVKEEMGLWFPPPQVQPQGPKQTPPRPAPRMAHGWHHFLREGFLSVKWSGSSSINCPKSVYLGEIIGARIGLPRWRGSRETTCQCRRCRRCGFNPSVWKILWRKEWQLTATSLPGESHGQRSRAGCSPRGVHTESCMTERLSTNRRSQHASEEHQGL